MTDANASPPRAKSARGAPSPSLMFAMPTFDMPKFDMPKFEVPGYFRDFAEQGVAQARETCEKVNASVAEATDLFWNTYATVAKGAADYNLKLIETTLANTNAAFGYARELLDIRSFSAVMELSASRAREQFGMLSEQTKELAALAQKVSVETAEPFKTSVGKVFKKVA